MIANRLVPALAAASLVLALSACGPKGHDEDEQAEANAPVSAEGRAQEGTISVKAPGVDIAIRLPKEITGEAKADKNSKLLYPGATLAGMAIAAGGKEGQGGDTDVEMRFRTADAPDKVAAWYRDPGRTVGFTLKGAARNGANIVFTGVERDGHNFKVTLAPGANGGTEGRLRVHHGD
jgi:hypothetical protein